MTVGTDLEIIPPARSEILGADAERLPTLQTTAKSDADLVAVWLKSHADGSPHTLRAYERIGRRFVAALAAARTDLRHATVDHVQAALEAMRSGLNEYEDVVEENAFGQLARLLTKVSQ